MVDNSSMQDTTSLLTLPLTGLILAGGAGQRMGGLDKGWVPYRGRPLVSYAMACLGPHVRELLISANRSQQQYRTLGCKVIGDLETGFQGPLRGMEAGWQACSDDWMAFAAVDCPHLPANLVPRLWALRQEYPLVLAADSHGMIPVVGLMHRQILPALRKYLAEGGLRAGTFLGSHPHTLLQLGDGESSNLNRLSDMA